MSSILVVTDELFPWTNGGIGKLVYEQTKSLSSHGHEVQVLFCGEKPSSDYLQGTLPIHYLDDTVFPIGNRTDSWLVKSDSHIVREKSARIARCIENLNQKGFTYDFIEFADYQGLAFCTINAKRLGRISCKQLITVRIHSTLYSLRPFDSGWGTNLNEIYEMEVFSLVNADLVVSHLPGIAKSVNSELQKLGYKGFRNSIVSFPDLFSQDILNVSLSNSIKTRNITRIMFTSKIQPFKRPDIFVRGLNLFFASNPQLQGVNAELMARDPHDEFSNYVKFLSSSQHKSRFIFTSIEEQKRRFESMRGNVVVFTSEYESLCLAAYEASVAGAIVVLNKNNPAFDDESRWIDGVNCFKFSGDALSLNNILQYIFEKDEIGLMTVDTTPEACEYCNSKQTFDYLEIETKPVQISFAIPHRNQVEELINLLRYLVEMKFLCDGDEVLVVDDLSDRKFRELLESRIVLLDFTHPIRLIFNKANLGLAATRNILIENASRDVIFFVDADDLPGDEFVREIRNSFAQNPEIQFIFGSTALSSMVAQTSKFTVSRIVKTYGPGKFSTFPNNMASSSSFAFRSSIAAKLKFDETLIVFEDWDFLNQLVHENYNYAVSESPSVFYFQSASGMLGTSNKFTKDVSMDRIFAKGHSSQLAQISYDAIRKQQAQSLSYPMAISNNRLMNLLKLLNRIRIVVAQKIPALDSILFRIANEVLWRSRRFLG